MPLRSSHTLILILATSQSWVRAYLRNLLHNLYSNPLWFLHFESFRFVSNSGQYPFGPNIPDLDYTLNSALLNYMFSWLDHCLCSENKQRITSWLYCPFPFPRQCSAMSVLQVSFAGTEGLPALSLLSRIFQPTLLIACPNLVFSTCSALKTLSHFPLILIAEISWSKTLPRSGRVMSKQRFKMQAKKPKQNKTW